MTKKLTTLIVFVALISIMSGFCFRPLVASANNAEHEMVGHDFHSAHKYPSLYKASADGTMSCCVERNDSTDLTLVNKFELPVVDQVTKENFDQFDNFSNQLVLDISNHSPPGSGELLASVIKIE